MCALQLQVTLFWSLFWYVLASCSASVISEDMEALSDPTNFTTFQQPYAALGVERSEAPWDVYGLTYFYLGHRALVSFTGHLPRQESVLCWSFNSIYSERMVCELFCSLTQFSPLSWGSCCIYCTWNCLKEVSVLKHLSLERVSSV